MIQRKITKLVNYLGLYLDQYGEFEETKDGAMPDLDKRLERLERLQGINKYGMKLDKK